MHCFKNQSVTQFQVLKIKFIIENHCLYSVIYEMILGCIYNVSKISFLEFYGKTSMSNILLCIILKNWWSYSMKEVVNKFWYHVRNFKNVIVVFRV